MKKAKERLDMSLERQTGIPTEYLHQDARITIDMDSTAKSFRAISTGSQALRTLPFPLAKRTTAARLGLRYENVPFPSLLSDKNPC